MKYDNIVVMGVAGCGKSSVGRMLAEALHASFIEGDSFHPQGNIARMSAGIPLDDSNRADWLASLAERLRQGRAGKERMVLACSALKKRYRDILRGAAPGLLFVHLHGDKALIAQRMQERSAHFMPTSLLDSQFHDLETPGPDERAIHCDISQPPAALLQQILQALA
ncbi:gluconokinase [Chromobacterium sphagni]|uniref:Gluconokinase n=1 Tax=Chromobacterium sphagni TaxID=1903179 RepID=A0A1S1WWB2_9NEIS|nr:gluconokinase [Chromobacterium sphagni]OHX11492.1 gluconate kinase [Chromobacterium sphagni]OHX17775.1 gluconate kinase [Chromobacterium sphagni]